jgi:hypothetical protein
MIDIRVAKDSDAPELKKLNDLFNGDGSNTIEAIEKSLKEKGWGKSIVEVLSKELQKEFPGVQGFSARNLWNMRNFYLAY